MSTSIDSDFSLIAFRTVRRRAYSDDGRGCFSPAAAVDASPAAELEDSPQAFGASRWSSGDLRFSGSTLSGSGDVTAEPAAETVRCGGEERNMAAGEAPPADGERSRAGGNDGDGSREAAGDAEDGEVLRRPAAAAAAGRCSSGGVGDDGC